MENCLKCLNNWKKRVKMASVWRPHRSNGERQHRHHPVPQADQLLQLALLLPAVGSFGQQTGHVDQDAQPEEHGLDHLQEETQPSEAAQGVTSIM